MNDQEKRTLEMFKRVRDFDAANPGLFSDDSLGRELFDAIGRAVRALEAQAAAESAGRGTTRQGTTGKAVAREEILEGLRILRRTARSMSVEIPGVEDKFRPPYKGDDQELLITARAALAEAESLRTQFLRREVPEQVFQELAADIAAFEASLTNQHTGKGASTTAAALIDAAIESGMDALRQLDAIVRNKLHNNPALLAAWLSAKRIERAPRRNHTPTPPAPQPPNE
jgi:hypothetical protein